MVKPTRKDLLPAADVVPIVGDGAIAGPVAEGVMIPVVILDTSQHPHIEEIIRVQGHVAPGDVTSQWGGLESDPDAVVLALQFVRPIEARAILRFGIESQAILVEAALCGRAIYLQAGKPGDRLKHDLSRPKLLVELPGTGFRPAWDEILLKRMITVMARRGHLSRRKAELLARQAIEQMRTMVSFRMPRR